MRSSPVVILETARLILRKLTLDDLDALAVLYSDPDVRRYFPEKTLTYAETKEELEWIIDVYYGQYGYGLWATIFRETGDFIGRCGLLPWKIDGQVTVEVAYLLDKRYWGRGLATEAARAIADYAFEQLQVPRLICMANPENTASTAVAQKLGMTLEGPGIVEDYPTVLYSMHNPKLGKRL